MSLKNTGHAEIKIAGQILFFRKIKYIGKEFIYSRNAVHKTLRAKHREIFRIQAAEEAQEKRSACMACRFGGIVSGRFSKNI